MKKSTFPGVIASVLIFAGVGYALLQWNPMDYVLEAGGPAYYQARIAYERGSTAQRVHITEAFKDGKISMYDYQKVVFPSYLTVARDREELFPADESRQSMDELRRRLAIAVRPER